MVSNLNREGRSGNGGFMIPKNEKTYLEKPENTFQFRPMRYQKRYIDRLLFTQIIEAISCYEKNIITSIQDANIGSILGLGSLAILVAYYNL